MSGASPAYDEVDGPKWFGDYAERAGERAWDQLEKWVKRRFAGCHVLATPVQTALALAEHSFPWQKDAAPYHYHVLPEAERALIARHCGHGQHRYEECAQSGETLEQVVLYDARIAHLAHSRHLPVLLQPDGLIHDAGPFVPWRRGFYRVEVTIPRSWRHIGLAPAPDASSYPNKPGFSFESWLSWREVHLLEEQSWPYHINERILFAPLDTPGADPLRQFGEVLSTSLEKLDALARDEVIGALRVALRALALHLIGNFARSAREDPAEYDSLADLPADLSPSAAVSHEGQKYLVRQPKQLDLYHARWYRPEWAAAIWADTRVMTTRKALEVSRDELVVIDGDGLYLRSDPGWRDTGKVGCYRHQATWRGSLTLPRQGIGHPQRDTLRALKAGRDERMTEVH